MARTLEYTFDKYPLNEEIMNIFDDHPGLLKFKVERRALILYGCIADFIFEGLVELGVISSYHSKWHGSKKAVFC
ncbi:MAG: hypothetical protein Q8K60_05380 [Parachlamydiaceae bacterium]|nr:hypothetical protein [Parachlamydiaceae bacterium]